MTLSLRFCIAIFMFLALIALPGLLIAAPLFEDDFSGKSVNAQRWKPSRTWSIKDESLKIFDEVSDGNSDDAFGFSNPKFTDFVWQMDLKILSQPTPERLGLLFRANGVEQFYEIFLIPKGFFRDPSSLVWFVRSGGRETWKSMKSEPIVPEFKEEEWYTIRVAVQGTSFDLYMKKRDEPGGIQKVSSWSDPKNVHKEGTIGFHTSRFTNVLIDNLLIFKNLQDAPNLPVNPKGNLSTTWGKIKLSAISHQLKDKR
jgi:hypothetical protein